MRRVPGSQGQEDKQYLEVNRIKLSEYKSLLPVVGKGMGYRKTKAGERNVSDGRKCHWGPLNKIMDGEIKKCRMSSIMK